MSPMASTQISRNQEINLAYKALRLCACAFVSLRGHARSAVPGHFPSALVADLAHGLPSLAGHILCQKKHGVIIDHFQEDVVALEDALCPADKGCIDAAEPAREALLEPA